MSGLIFVLFKEEIAAWNLEWQYFNTDKRYDNGLWKWIKEHQDLNVGILYLGSFFLSQWALLNKV